MGRDGRGRRRGAGDILYHYNRPYGDIYMKVGEPFRKRGLGSFLVQELKRICYEGGSVPARAATQEHRQPANPSESRLRALRAHRVRHGVTLNVTSPDARTDFI